MSDKKVTKDEIIATVREVAGKEAAERSEAVQKKVLEAIEKHGTDVAGLKDEFKEIREAFAKSTKQSFARVGSSRDSAAAFGEIKGAGIEYEVRAAGKGIGTRPTVARHADKEEFFPHGIAPRIMRCIAIAESERHVTPKAIAERMGFPVTARALDTQVLADGGSLIAPEVSSEIIEALREYAVVRAAGPVVTPLRGTRSQPFINVGSTASYTGENVTVNANQPTTGAVLMSERKLRNVVPFSNEMLRLGGPSVEQTIMRDMARGIAVREDLAFLRGVGASYEPKGLAGWVVSGNKFNSDASPTVDKITKELAKAPRLLEDAKVAISRGHYFLAPREAWYLRALRTSDGAYAFPEVSAGLLLGFPFSRTQQIPINLGGGTNQSFVLFANMDDIELGQGESVAIEAFPGGAYKDSSGTMQSGISNDQTVIAMTESHDLIARQRGNEISQIEQVVWGA